MLQTDDDDDDDDADADDIICYLGPLVPFYNTYYTFSNTRIVADARW